MPRYSLIESRPRVLPLDSAQAAELQRVGRALASEPGFWSGVAPDARRSVLDCQQVPRGYRVTVNNCIGAVGVGDVVLNVVPKIPREHFLYLMQLAGRLPRTESPRALAAQSEMLWPMVVGWFLSAAEGLLVRQLARGYSEAERELPFLRGRIDMPRSATGWFARGSSQTLCTFEEFDVDTPANRVVKRAAQLVAGSPLVSSGARRRAVGIIDHMGDVGPMDDSDPRRAELTRDTSYYADALSLALDVIGETGRFPGLADQTSWTFLIRTPELVQDAIRRLLRDGLMAEMRPDPSGGRLQLAPARVTVNPDLVFRTVHAIGDVKYKLDPPRDERSPGGWRRSDLYEVVAFAAAYRFDRAVVLGFNRRGFPEPAPVGVGDIAVRHVSWSVRRGLAPEEAAAALVADVRDALAS